MSDDPRFCTKCGTRATGEASFCAKCGAFVGEAPSPPVAAPPPVPQVRTVERRYARYDVRDLDMKNMAAHGWVIMGQSQESGGHWRVLYGTTAPPGQAVLPAEVRVKQGAKPTRVLALVGGVVLLFICVGMAFSSNSGSTTASGGSTATTVAPPSMSLATYLDPRLLASNPTAYKGNNIYIQGKVLNVEQHSDYTWVQIMAQPSGKDVTESIVVEMRPRASELLKDECFRIYGTAQGTTGVTRTLTGASNTVPLVHGYAYSSVSAGSYGIGCASPSTTR